MKYDLVIAHEILQLGFVVDMTYETLVLKHNIWILAPFLKFKKSSELEIGID